MQFSPAASRPRENGYDGIHRSPVECWPREKRQRIPTRFVILCARTVTVKVASCHLLIGRSARSDADRALPVSHDLQKQEVALCCLAELRIGMWTRRARATETSAADPVHSSLGFEQGATCASRLRFELGRTHLIKVSTFMSLLVSPCLSLNPCLSLYYFQLSGKSSIFATRTAQLCHPCQEPAAILGCSSRPTQTETYKSPTNAHCFSISDEPNSSEHISLSEEATTGFDTTDASTTRK